MSAGSDGKIAWRQSASEQSCRAPSAAPNIPGIGSSRDGEPLLRRVVHRREDHQRRGVLHPESGDERGEPEGPERRRLRHHPLRDLGTGLLMQLEDTHLLRMKARRRGESSMESVIEDYRYVNGVNISHGGHTAVTLFPYGEGSVNHKRNMEEMDFNLWGLSNSNDCFIPPANLKSRA